MFGEGFLFPSFTIFGFRFYMYGISLVVGVAVALLVELFGNKQFKDIREDFLTSIVYALIGGVVGAKLLYLIVSIPRIVENPAIFISVLTEGIVFYGALIGGILGFVIYCVRYKMPFWKVSSSAVAAIPLAHSFGRIGCFLAGCCYGRPTDSIFGVVYSGRAFCLAPSGVALHPTQLYSSFGNLVLFFILFFLEKKSVLKDRLLGLYLLLYAIMRFIIEFFRSDDRGGIGIFSTSQIVAMFMVVFGVLILFGVLQRFIFKNEITIEEFAQNFSKKSKKLNKKDCKNE